MIKGISHITLIVKDIELTSNLFREILNAKEVYSSNEDTFSISKEKFFLIANQWFAIMQGEPLSKRTYNHIAFKISEKDLATYKTRIKKIGIKLETPRTRIAGEGKSIYFYDYDNHLFELHTGTLKARLTTYKKQ